MENVKVLLFSDPAEPVDVPAVEEPSAAADPLAGLRRLSRRELETFDLVVNGRTTREISLDLGISPHTADHYRRRVYEKLGVRDIVGAVRYAARAGWFAEHPDARPRLAV